MGVAGHPDAQDYPKYPGQKVQINELLLNLSLDHYEFERKFKAFDILTLNQSVKSALFLHSEKAIF
jgi:hypothetical protein